MDRGAWRAMVHTVAQSDTTDATELQTCLSLMWFDLPFFFLIACAFGMSQLIPSQTNVKELLPWMECSVYMY